MLSETQERMLLVVDEVPEDILARHDIPYSVIGKVIPENRYVVKGHCDIVVEELVIPPQVPLDFSEAPQVTRPWQPHTFAPQERYDHTVGARTQFSPDDDPQFNALWLWEENCSLGIYTFSAANAYEGIINAANKLQARGYTPAGITNCLNFANPETPPVMHEFRKTILQIKQACEQLEIPVCSGNVSFYNRVINTPTFTLLGVNVLGSTSVKP
jgi:phosphoribosylformylglycinamidine synthase